MGYEKEMKQTRVLSTVRVSDFGAVEMKSYIRKLLQLVSMGGGVSHGRQHVQLNITFGISIYNGRSEGAILECNCI